MADIQTLLARVEAHIARTGAARSTISRKLFGNGNRLDEIKRGGTLTLRKMQEAEATLADMEKAPAQDAAA